MLKRFISKVVDRTDLSEAESGEAMAFIMGGEVPPTQIASFITALRMKGETIQEITGFARTMREKAVHIRAKDGEQVVDTCGTGGDGKGTFNISTAVAFVAAGGGCTVAKHHNRSVSSQCGSADVLEALGVNYALPPERAEASLQKFGLAFLFAPTFHPATRHALVPRREIGIRTVFNLLGPLTNPAGASAQVIGVYEPALTEKIAHVLKRLGTREAFVVCGEGTLDEISICGPTRISHLKNEEVRTFDLTPEEVGLKRAAPEAIRGGEALENARIIREILDGQRRPNRDIVLINTAAAFVAAGLDSCFKEGIERAKASIDSGRAKEKLQRLIAFTQQCGNFLRKEL